MPVKKVNSLLLILSFACVACGQTANNRLLLGKANAEQELAVALNEKGSLNVIDNKTLIVADSATAISIAEPILFNIYGKHNITMQRPYEIYLLNNYWVINGTLPENTYGGTFEIIMDARDARIIKIIHGK